MNTSIFEFNSGCSGKTVTIMCGVHGDEKSGIDACKNILNELQLISGKVYIVFANTQAIIESKRFIEKNMNRCFYTNNIGNTLEEQRVIEILPYLKESDILLDIHNTLNKSTQPFLISEHKEYNNLFNVPIVVSGLDNLHPGGSDGYMNSIGKIGLCLECGYKDDAWGTPFAKEGILNLLRYTGNIEGKVKSYNEAKHIHTYDIYKADTSKFEFNKQYGDFDEIKKGEEIAKYNDRAVLANNDCIILFPNNSKNNLEEQFVIGKLF